MINADLTHIHQCVYIHQLRDGRDFVQDDLQLVSFFIHNSLEHKWQHYYQSNQTLINWAQQYLDFLSGQRFHLSLLSDGEAVCQDFGSSGDRHFELVSVLLDLRNALDVFTFLYQIIRKTWNSMQVMSNVIHKILNAMRATLHTMHATLHAMYEILHAVHKILNAVHKILNAMHGTLNAMLDILNAMVETLNAMHEILHALH